MERFMLTITAVPLILYAIAAPIIHIASTVTF